MIKTTNLKGYSLIELLMVCLILGILTPFLVSIFFNIMNTTTYNIAVNNQKKFDSVLVSRLGKIINASVKFIGREINQPPVLTNIVTPTNMSEFYLSIINPATYNLSGYNYVPLNINSRILPVLDPIGTFSPLNSTGNQGMNAFNGNNIGNSLIVVTIEDSLTYRYDNTGKYVATPTATTFEKRFPLYQIHYFYLAKAIDVIFYDRSIKETNLNKIPNSNLLLLEWKSNYMISYEDLSEFINNKLSGTNYIDLNDFKTNIITLKTDLSQNIPIDSVWNFSETNYLASNKLLKLSTISKSSSGSNFVLSGTEYSSINKLETNHISNIAMYPNPDEVSYGIAPNNFDLNNKTASYNMQVNNLRAPFFEQIPLANFNNALDGFPNGLEIMLSGTAGSTKAFFRMLSLASGKNVKSYNITQVILQGKN